MATAAKLTRANMGRARTAPAQTMRPPQARRTFENVLIMIMIVGLAAIFLPTTIVASFAMLPTLIAFFFDRDPKKNLTLCIGALNAAGSTPVMLDLWSRWNSVAGALGLVSSVTPWVYAWGGALAGFALCWGIPPIAAMLVRNGLESKLVALQDQGAKMQEWWGPEVAPSHLAAVVGGEPAPRA